MHGLIRWLLVLALVPAGHLAANPPVYKTPPHPQVNPWQDKGIPSRYTFGAYYTRLSPEKPEDWDLYSRTDEYADIMVRFGSGPGQVLFGRETSYLPVWDNGKRRVPFRQVVSRYGDGPWNRPDRINRHARARIIQSDAQRVVVHWRYMPRVIRPFPDRLPDQTTFVDEYFVIFPDRTVLRAVHRGCAHYEDWLAGAPGEVFRYRLGDEERNEIKPVALKAGDRELMLQVMAMPQPPKVQPAPVRRLPVDLPKPVLEMTFDASRGRMVKDLATGRLCPVRGHSALWRTGISGTALEFDGWTTRLPTDLDLSRCGAGPLTVDFWLAIAAYPWSPCSLLEQVERAENGQPIRGLLVSLDPDGLLTVSLKYGSGGSWLRLTSEKIPRHQWTRITLVYDPAANGTGRLYLNGRCVAQDTGGPADLPPGTLLLGRGGSMDPSRPRHFNQRYPFTFDGLLDELRIYDKPLSRRQIEQGTSALGGQPGEGIDTDVTRRRFPTDLADVRRFAAHYTHLNFHPAWDRLFRMAGHPDIVVTFDKIPCRYVLWHGVGYIPMLVNENNFWYSNEFNETWGYGGCYEPMSDKRVVYGRVHILEQSPARLVLKWRYPLSDVHYEIHGERTDWADAVWGKWAAWYLTIYPDGTMVKRMRVYSGRPIRLEWHESMAIMAPNQKPEDILATRPALTLVGLDGTVRRYDWIDTPPTDVNYDNTVVHVVNMVGRYDPYTIQRIVGGNVYKSNNRGTGYSPFPSWNHWPVAQLPSDRFDTHHPHRAAHSSVTHILWAPSVPWGQQGAFEEKLLLEGLSDRPAEQLLPLARSWLNAPPATVSGGADVQYKMAERAYEVVRHSGRTERMTVKLAGSSASPVFNPAIIVPNWASDRPARVTCRPAAAEVRQGVVRRANGVNALVLWLELQSTAPVEITIE